MKFRFGAFVLLGFAFALAGCGAPGAAGGGAANGLSPQDLMQEMDDEEIPDWVDELPEGREPEDNTYTAQAELALVQAFGAEDEAEANELFEEVLSLARQGMAEYPENAESYYHAGEALFALGRYEEGVEMFDRAEEIYPRFVLETMFTRESAWVEELNDGFDRQDAGDIEGAIEKFETAHMVYQFRPEAMLNLGAAYSQVGRYDDSIEMFRMSIDVIEGPWGDRTDEETREGWLEQLEVARANYAQLLLMQERYDEAADAFSAILDSDPDNLEALSGYGASLVGAGRMDEAEALFDELLNRPGLNAADYYSIGVGLYQAESLEQAALAFYRSYEIAPGHRDVVYNLAQSYYLSDQFEELLPVAEQLLEVDPLNFNAYSFLGQALLQLDRQDEGLEVLDQRDELEYVIEGLGLQFAGDDIVVAGEMVNRGAAAGTAIQLRFHFYDVDGDDLGSQDLTVDLAAEGEPAVFQLAAPDTPTLFGFRYEVL